MVAAISAISGVSAAPIEQQVTFPGANGITLAGTLVLPERARAEHSVPAMLLVQGSGPTDRDGNQPPSLRTDLLREVAGFLAAQNIGSLRFDKRGMYANRQTLPKRPEELPQFFSWTAMVDDAAGAFGFLAAQPAIDAARVGVLGHSEGGLMALDLARRSQRKPTVLVLVATPGRMFGEVVHDQLSALLDRQGATPEQRRFFLEADRRIRAQILASGQVPSDVPPGLAALYPGYLGPYFKSVLALDPPALAKEFKGPLLVINGTADTQVSATSDAPQFAAALAGRADGSEVVTPVGVSHSLKTVAGADHEGVAGPVDAGVRESIVRWLRARL
jgi:pimeloyl-ACP methyl ester carboxylesterase